MIAKLLRCRIPGSGLGQRVAGTHTFRRVAVERSELTVLGNTSTPQAVRMGHDLNQKFYKGAGTTLVGTKHAPRSYNIVGDGGE